MHSCISWGIGLVSAWALVLFWHLQAGQPPVLWNGLAYAGVGIAAMGLVSHCFPNWHPALRRVSALLTCSMLAGIDVGVSGQGGEAGQKMFFAALLGIALAVLMAKHAPTGLRRTWLGERADP